MRKKPEKKPSDKKSLFESMFSILHGAGSNNGAFNGDSLTGLEAKIADSVSFGSHYDGSNKSMHGLINVQTGATSTQMLNTIVSLSSKNGSLSQRNSSLLQRNNSLLQRVKELQQRCTKLSHENEMNKKSHPQKEQSKNDLEHRKSIQKSSSVERTANSIHKNMIGIDKNYDVEMKNTLLDLNASKSDDLDNIKLYPMDTSMLYSDRAADSPSYASKANDSAYIPSTNGMNPALDPGHSINFVPNDDLNSTYEKQFNNRYHENDHYNPSNDKQF